MAQISPEDIFDFQVVAALADERYMANTTLLQSGYVVDARGEAIVNGSGTKIEVPYWKNSDDTNVGVQKNKRDGTKVTADKEQFSSFEVDIEDDMLAYDLDTKAMRMMARLADPNTALADRVVYKANLHIQKAIIAAGEAAGIVYKDPEGAMTWNGIRRGLTKSWGEKNDVGIPLNIVHPNVMHDLITSDEAKKSLIFGGKETIESGTIYQFAGTKVMQLGSITKNADGTYNNLIVLPGMLQFWNDEDLQFGVQRRSKTTTYELDWWFSFCAFVKKSTPTGVIVFQAPATLDVLP